MNKYMNNFYEAKWVHFLSCFVFIVFILYNITHLWILLQIEAKEKSLM